MSQSRVYLAVFINVRCDHPRTRGMVKVEDRAFADVDKEADVLLAPGIIVLVGKEEEEGVIRLTLTCVAARHQFAGICHSGSEGLASSSRCFVHR